ncbi:ABC transporter substrate-binding protein, partial [Chloroflexi bacterium TSY]|nr:ABC transporter substrate-binding protein [Chloroflexi bacterium TSY]
TKTLTTVVHVIGLRKLDSIVGKTKQNFSGGERNETPTPICYSTLLSMLALTACAGRLDWPRDGYRDHGDIFIRGGNRDHGHSEYGELDFMEPALSSDGASLQARNLLWPALINTDETTGAPVPGLQSWEVSEDTLTYTFQIREDAVWSDGVSISSADVKFMIEAIQSDIETVYETAVEQIEAVNIIDEKNYEIVLSEINCAFLSSFGAIRLLPAHKYAADFSDFETSDFNMNPDVSGGPYILEEWAPTEFEAYRANPDYWGGAPGIPNLVNRVMEDATIGVQAIQAGEVDYMTMQGDLFQQITNRDHLNWSSYPQTSVGFLSLNWKDPDDPQSAYDEDGNPIEQAPHPLFGDVRVRKAVALGVNVQDMIDAMGPDGGTPLVGTVSPFQAGPITMTFRAIRTIQMRPWPCLTRLVGLIVTVMVCARKMVCLWLSRFLTALFYRCLRPRP